eukprot:2567341-Lingulodinium_polyedra.AAC.1
MCGWWSPWRLQPGTNQWETRGRPLEGNNLERGPNGPASSSLGHGGGRNFPGVSLRGGGPQCRARKALEQY